MAETRQTAQAAQPYERREIPRGLQQPTNALDALRWIYQIRGRIHYYGAWVKVSVQLSEGDISFASHRVGDRGDEVFATLEAARKLWEMLEDLRE